MSAKNVKESFLRLILPEDLFTFKIPHARWDMHVQNKLAVVGIALAQLSLEPLELLILTLVVIGLVIAIHIDRIDREQGQFVGEVPAIVTALFKSLEYLSIILFIS